MDIDDATGNGVPDVMPAQTFQEGVAAISWRGTKYFLLVVSVLDVDD